MGRGEGRGLLKSGVREDLREVRLVDCFEFFGLFFVSVLGDGFARE